MSSPIYIPSSGFNNNPVSTTVRTASYTIPAGRYARIVAECDSGGIVTINGSNAMTSSAFINVANTGSVGFSTSTFYTVPSNYRLDTAAITSASSTSAPFIPLGGTNISIGGANFNQGSVGASFGPGQILQIYNNTGYVVGVATPSNATNRQGEFWLPTGTVLSGTGNWRAVVTEYNT